MEEVEGGEEGRRGEEEKGKEVVDLEEEEEIDRLKKWKFDERREKMEWAEAEREKKKKERQRGKGGGKGGGKGELKRCGSNEWGRGLEDGFLKEEEGIEEVKRKALFEFWKFGIQDTGGGTESERNDDKYDFFFFFFFFFEYLIIA